MSEPNATASNAADPNNGTPVVIPTATEPSATEPAGKEDKTVSFDEHQRAMTGQYKAGIAAAMKEAGFEPERSDDFKAQMKAFKEWQDSQKSEAEKSAAALLEAQKAVEAERTKAAAMENRFLAVGKGIPPHLAEKYVKLAETYQDEKTDLSAALELALKDFPIKTAIPIAVAPGTPEPDGVKSEMDKRLEKFRRK